MEVKFTDSFFTSFKTNVIDANKWYKFKFWQHKYWDFTRGIKNLITYFKVVFNIYPWNADIPILSLTKVSLQRVLKYIESGAEVPESKLPKIKDIKRTIELIDNYLEDNYAERCGWKIENKGLFDPPNERNREAIKQSIELQDKEWEELFTLLKKMYAWWD